MFYTQTVIPMRSMQQCTSKPVWTYLLILITPLKKMVIRDGVAVWTEGGEVGEMIERHHFVFILGPIKCLYEDYLHIYISYSVKYTAY